MKIIKKIFIPVSVLTIFSISLFVADYAYSRAGGGGSYKSSSSSSSKSSSRSSSSSSSSSSKSKSSSYKSGSSGYIPPIIPVPIPLGSHKSGTAANQDGIASNQGGSTAAVEKKEASTGSIIIGLIVIILFAVVGFFILRWIFRKIFGFGKSDKDDGKPPVFSISDSVLADMRVEDPNFSPEHFYDLSKTIAEKVQSAWSAGDMISARNYISQGIYNRFKVQLEMMKDDEGVINVVGNYRVKVLNVMALDLSHSYQTLHVRLTSRAKDATLPVGSTQEQIQKALDKAQDTSFTEIFSYTRKRSAKTDTSKNYLTGQCPSCGFVPDNFSEVNKCPSCGSIYNSGEFDWVLSEITQESEWQESSYESIEGLKDLETMNLSINREVIEDRASFLFWKWMQSQTKGDKNHLARDASSGFMSNFNPVKTYMAEVVVGASDLKKVWQDNDKAYASVLIFWSASLMKKDEPVHRESTFTLSMPLALKNPYGLANHSCNSCGGPLPDTTGTACTYCGAALPATVADWILENVDEVNLEAGNDVDEE
jgi:rubrerythrin